MPFPHPGKSVMVFFSAIALSACASSGNNFNAKGVSQLVSGETTFIQARNFLQADPVIVYPQSDGSFIARWAHKTTVSTDAIYFNREIWLLFGPDGRFMRVLKSENVLDPSKNNELPASAGDTH